MANVSSAIAWPLYNPNNGQMCDGTIDEAIVCAQSTTVTLSQAYLMPENSLLQAMTFYVSVIPGGTTTFAMGDEFDATRYGSLISTTAGTSGIILLGGISQLVVMDSDPLFMGGEPILFNSTSRIKLTFNTAPTDALGRIRVIMHYRKFLIPNQ